MITNDRTGSETWQLSLYVADETPRSLTAIANLKRLCEGHLSGHHRIEVIDVVQDPHPATENQIVALPTLVRWWRTPVRRLLGDLSNTERVLAALGLGANR